MSWTRATFERLQKQIDVLCSEFPDDRIVNLSAAADFFRRWCLATSVVIRDRIGEHERKRFVESVSKKPPTGFAPRKALFYQVRQALGILRPLVRILEHHPEQMVFTEPAVSNASAGRAAKEAGPIPNTIFFGHGRSPAWRVMKDFVVETLGLQYEEFNRESAAGLPHTTRLSQMLDRCGFAFLVFTSEDQHTDGTQHARENVIHEAGLFQGKLGFERAIILLEEGCQEFSNIHGLGQVRFPRGDPLAASEEIRKVLVREQILK